VTDTLLGYEGEVVAVTGAASGMGREAAALLIELGADVHALDISPIDLPVAGELCIELSDEGTTAGVDDPTMRVI
jgi:NAD(P)-dependent dehydrogenase (short-subunit alcohol dehydrogenase family)